MSRELVGAQTAVERTDQGRIRQARWYWRQVRRCGEFPLFGAQGYCLAMGSDEREFAGHDSVLVETWRESYADDIALLDQIARGLTGRPYSAAEVAEIEASAARIKGLIDIYEAENPPGA